MALELGGGPQGLQDFGHEMDVTEIWDTAEDARFGGQQGRSHQGQGGVLRSADRDLTVQWCAAFDKKPVHSINTASSGHIV
jgi:hypothetical protein